MLDLFHRLSKFMFVLIMENNYITISDYHELPHYTNIYSLSVFDIALKRACIISTSKHIYQLILNDDGKIQVLLMKLNKLYDHIKTVEIEIQGQTVLNHKGSIYLGLIYRTQKENNLTFSIGVLKYLNKDKYTPDRVESVDLNYIPYKISIVSYIQRLIEEELILFVTGNDEVYCNNINSI